MKTRWIHRPLTILAGLCLGAVSVTAAETPAPTVYPTAILPFQERGPELKDMGGKVADVLFATLAAEPSLYLVDRAEMDKLAAEAELNLSGMVASGQTTKLGELCGARILVTGNVMQVDQSIYLVAKIIGTETSRVLGQSVKGDASAALDVLAEQLAAKVAETIQTRGAELVPPPEKPEDRIAALKATLGDAKRPVLLIRILERHVGQATIDPAAQTELAMICGATGFEVLDANAGKDRKPDIIVDGEGFSEFGLRRGALVSVKARLEVKAVEVATDKVLASDRQTAVVVDLTEQIAGKAALQKAAAAIAERLLPALVKR
ncbi:MAG: hypothetical protein GX595_01535 [Lentisphaerae bacterium]|nr:hypothetical protein [Lentisphaerota bacterium]